ncbi:MAG: hypothetical protein D9N11_02010 [Ketobacter sp.]|nr:MAG: hypothetical protein D9N11_02010 [Ketobacter sp.]
MLIQPAQPNVTNVAAYGSITPSGVERELARADIPPVEEAEKNAGTQNRLFAPGPGDNTTQQSASEPATSGQTAEEAQKPDEKPSANRSNSQLNLSDEDLALLEQLKARDREVRVHEAAHASVGGRYAGSASFQYTRGPDGRNYATGGEVSISVSEVAGDPQATIEKARVIRAAALAPAEPSAQDRRVAAEAAQLELSARSELQSVRAEESQTEKAERAEKQNSATDEPVEDVESEEPAAVSAPPVQVQAADESAADVESDSEPQEEQPANAREELEKILLGSQGLLQQANQLGLVDPQNPYGKSGFLDVIA